MLSVDSVKGIVLVGLFLLTFGIGIIPVKIVNIWRKKSLEDLTQPNSQQSRQEHDNNDHVILPKFKRAISLLSCFAAGVFLATCFLDLLPGVRQTMVHVLYRFNVYTGFPVSEFVMVIGFFLILITEQIVLTYKQGQMQSETDIKKPLLTNDNWSEESLNSEHSLTGIKDYREKRIDTEDNSHHSSLRSLVLLIALSLHSVFEGLAVGLQKTSGDVVGIFAALIVHKSILSFSLGLNLVQSKLSKNIVVRSVFLFSISAPLGVGIGMGIINLWDSTTSSLIQGLLTGIATGTFLFVTFFEVLPHEFNSDKDQLLKVLFLILGYSAVTGILFLSDDVKKPFCVVEEDLNN